MRIRNITTGIAATLLLGGCAGLRFTTADAPNAFVYNAAVPVALVKTAADCSKTVEMLTLPGPPRGVQFKSGFGSAKLNIKLDHNMITEIGQETDTKIPETITALAGAATAIESFSLAPRPACPSVALFQIVMAGDVMTFRRVTDFDAVIGNRVPPAR